MPLTAIRVVHPKHFCLYTLNNFVSLKKVVSFGKVSSELLKERRERERDARGRKKVFSAFLLFYSDVFFFSSVALRRRRRKMMM